MSPYEYAFTLVWLLSMLRSYVGLLHLKIYTQYLSFDYICYVYVHMYFHDAHNRHW